MKRWIAGVFDRRGEADGSRLASALAPDRASVVHGGALAVAYTGEASDARDPLCLLDGHLDNLAELRVLLEETSPGSSVEQLLAAGWRRWGADLPARLRGDFALLLWDEARGEGLLARDQL
ncbi:MAG TPA: hypothetical protein VGI27_03030, partial [Solirubrobacteraceae bacterium]